MKRFTSSHLWRTYPDSHRTSYSHRLQHAGPRAWMRVCTAAWPTKTSRDSWAYWLPLRVTTVHGAALPAPTSQDSWGYCRLPSPLGPPIRAKVAPGTEKHRGRMGTADFLKEKVMLLAGEWHVRVSQKED